MSRSVNHICSVTGKFRYAGPTEAGNVAITVTTSNVKNEDKNPEVGAYYCKHCIGWHVGHVARRPRRVKFWKRVNPR